MIEIFEKGFDTPRVHFSDEGITLNSQFGNGTFRAYHGKGFSLWENNYLFARDTVLQARANLPVLELHITRLGVWNGEWDGIEDMEYRPGQFNLTYTPHIMTSVAFRKNMQYRACDIHFEKSYLETLCADFPTLQIFLEAATKNEAGNLSSRNHQCTRDMIADLEIVRSYNDAEMLEVKVKDILIAALEKVSIDLEKPLPVLTRRQTEGLMHAKNLIESSEEVLTLSQLSAIVGINECSFKRGFKKLFGYTPYDFHVSIKMEKAKELLREGKESIASIAYILGYTQASSFGNEFRKATGMSPSEFRFCYLGTNEKQYKAAKAARRI